MKPLLGLAVYGLRREWAARGAVAIHPTNWIARIGLMILLGFVPSVASAQTFTSLLSFNGTDGFGPVGSLTLSGSTLYGTTLEGWPGPPAGTVFSLPVSGGTPTILVTFDNANGAWPPGNLTLIGSTLYGTTYFGELGDYYQGGGGTVFSVNTDATGFQTLLSFTGSNGYHPEGSLTPSGSTLYGMTSAGGLYGDGNVFCINTDGSGYKDLLDFNGTNGSDPWGSLTLSGSRLYGMTELGGANNDGVVFSMPISGGTSTALLSFSGSNGACPTHSNVTLSGSTLYGVTSGGTANDGNIFRINTDGTGFQNLLSFNGSNGANPWGSLTLGASMLYGTTDEGGAYNDGSVFQINTDGSGYVDLFDFNGSDGWGPQGTLTLSGSTLYGVTQGGGVNGLGTVFALTLPGQWATNGSGTWSGTANWTGGNVPGGNAQDTAVFGTILTSGTATVTLDSNRSLASLGFSTTGAASYLIIASGGSTLTLANTATGMATISNSGGNNAIAAPITLESNLSVSTATGMP